MSIFFFFFLQFENLQKETDQQKHHLQIPDMLRETLGTMSSSYCATQINWVILSLDTVI